MNEFIALDLFAGCGGLSCGLKSAGFQVIGALELDEFARRQGLAVKRALEKNCCP